MNQRMQRRSGVSFDSVKSSVWFWLSLRVYDPVKITKNAYINIFLGRHEGTERFGIFAFDWEIDKKE